MRKTIRMMIFNVGYLTGMSGLKKEYLLKSGRFIFPNITRKERLSGNLARLVKTIEPDILFLAEIRNEYHMNPIRNSFAKSHIDIKYGPRSILNALPFFRRNCNGLFLQDLFPVQKRYIENGSKKLVYQIDITEDFSVFFVHCALGKQTRKRQFSEIARMAAEKKHAVIAGDFNIFGGNEELEELLEKAGLRIAHASSDKTFPAFKPAHAIDLFLASPSIRETRVQVLNNPDTMCESDHLPVVADFEFQV